MSLWLASVPCSPSVKNHVSPDRALQALLGQPADPTDPDAVFVTAPGEHLSTQADPLAPAAPA